MATFSQLRQLSRITGNKSIWLIVVSAAVAAGCGGAFVPVQPYPKALVGIERVAVISLLGEQIEGEHDDINAKYDYWATAELGWDLNTIAFDAATDAMVGSGFELVRVDYDYSALWERVREGEKIIDELAALSDLYNLDAILVLTPGSYFTWHTYSKCYKHTQWGSLYCVGPGNYGYGVYHRTQPDDSTLTWDTVHLSETYVSIGISFVSKRNEFRPIAMTVAEAQVPLSIDEWKDSFSAYSPTEVASIREGLIEAAQEAIPTALQRMELKRSATR